MNKVKFIITTLVLFFFVSSAFAQKRRITGSVYDDLGGIMMANVVERDANNRIVAATVTDMNGNFSLVVVKPKDKISVSFAGYQKYEEVIGTTKNKFNIKLHEITLKEVVVKAKPMARSNGMAIPLKEVSVATQTMDMDDVEGLSFASADEALQLAAHFDFSGGQIENIARKRTVDYIVSGKHASLEDIENYCRAEVIDTKTTRHHIAGFSA